MSILLTKFVNAYDHFIIKRFIIINPSAMHMTNFVSKIDKNILRRVNFTNLKTSGGYIAKSKPQGACLQLSQTLRGDYAF